MGRIGGYIYSIHGDYKITNITGGGHHLVGYVYCWSMVDINGWFVMNVSCLIDWNCGCFGQQEPTYVEIHIDNT